MTIRNLAPYLGAGAHPRCAAAVFDPDLGNFRPPLEQSFLLRPEPVYYFNSLGFRGPDYDHGASLRVFVCGCSYAFGMGVEADRVWPVLFTRLAAIALDTRIEQSQVQNFSQIGASNNYVARTLVKQCHLAPPTIAIAAFTHTDRVEYLDGQEIRNIGHWDLRLDEQFPERPDSPGRRFFRQYSDRAGLQNLLANMVLVQSAMERRGVPYIMVLIDVERFQSARTMSSPVLRDYNAVLDRSRISRLSIKQPGILVDTVDGHPGPQSHGRFAAALVREFGGRLLARRSSSEVVHTRKTIDLGRLKRASADRLARRAISATASLRPGAVRLEFGCNLAVEHFAGDRAIQIDLERRAWTASGARLRAAFADYITVDLLRFNFWMSLLAAQEFILARGSRPEISVPENWLEEGTGNPVLRELCELVDDRFTSVVVRRASSRNIEFAARLDEAKKRVLRSRFHTVLCRVGRPPRTLSEDHNIYSLW